MAPLPRAALLAALTLAPLALAGAATSNHMPWSVVNGGDVTTAGFQFAPEVIVALPGQTITWRGNGFHTITSDDDGNLLASPGDGATFDMFLGANSQWTVPADADPGVLVYYCRPHISFGMRAVILVV